MTPRGAPTACDGTGNTRLSDRRREKLLNIKKREDLKGMLIEKYRQKYPHGTNKQSDCRSVCSAVIGREVDNFIKQASVTEANLSRLDKRMQRHSEGNVEDDTRSMVSGYSVAASVLSQGSCAS